jgi:hypothetical protein
MSKLYNMAMLMLAVLVIIAFFIPWVAVKSEQVGMVSKILTGKKQAVIDNISAFQVPILANGPDARLMLSVIKIVNPNVKDADKKSFLIWGIPFLAVIIFIVSHFFGNNKWANLIIGVLGVAIFIFASYKIKTTDFNKLVLNIEMGPGLWLTLWSFLLMGATGFIRFIAPAQKSK